MNITIIHLSETKFISSWNTTLLMPNSIECSCEVIHTHKYFILLFNQSSIIYQGDPIINLNTMNIIAKFIPTNESLISLKLAYNKWMNIFNSTYDDSINLDEIFGYNCQRLSLILRYVITKLLN
uniref:SJCHGC03383 protein n=1 Tax=Schistosoma japonicum TaxID=6182 RepID=Q5DFW6_SCHJA|nr:SJCHGC03383 protein [Schistosoma japonicum]